MPTIKPTKILTAANYSFDNPLGPDPGCINNMAYYTALKVTHASPAAESAAEQA